MRNIKVYTDGSWHDVDGLRDKTYGAIYIPSLEESEWTFYTNNPEYVRSHNVGGEVVAAEFAISLIARMFGEESKKEPNSVVVDMYYDYEGVGKWISGEWRAKKRLTQVYKKFVTTLLEENHIVLNLHHVKGHAGDAGNERADRLAREAYRSERCYNADSFVEDVLR